LRAEHLRRRGGRNGWRLPLELIWPPELATLGDCLLKRDGSGDQLK
jgi:hypothetical protein